MLVVSFFLMLLSSVNVSNISYFFPIFKQMDGKKGKGRVCNELKRKGGGREKCMFMFIRNNDNVYSVLLLCDCCFCCIVG